MHFTTPSSQHLKNSDVSETFRKWNDERRKHDDSESERIDMLRSSVTKHLKKNSEHFAGQMNDFSNIFQMHLPNQARHISYIFNMIQRLHLDNLERQAEKHITRIGGRSTFDEFSKWTSERASLGDESAAKTMAVMTDSTKKESVEKQTEREWDELFEDVPEQRSEESVEFESPERPYVRPAPKMDERNVAKRRDLMAKFYESSDIPDYESIVAEEDVHLEIEAEQEMEAVRELPKQIIEAILEPETILERTNIGERTRSYAAGRSR